MSGMRTPRLPLLTAREQRDPFAAIVGTRRGAIRTDAPREPTNLDRARELVPLVGASLVGRDFVDSALALRRRAHALGVDVVHGLFTSDADSDTETPLTLLFRPAGELIAVIEIDWDGSPGCFVQTP